MKKTAIMAAMALVVMFSACNTDKIKIPAFINVPDMNFREFLLDNYDSDHDGRISRTEVLAIESLDLRGKLITGETDRYTGYGIASLSGIEYFENLKSLNCGFNRITSLDMSRNRALRELECRDNKMTSLNIAGCTSLERVVCSFNSISTPNFKGCPALKSIDCKENPIKTLVVSSNAELEELNCYRTQISSINLSANRMLKRLVCDANGITDIDLSENTNLEELYCAGNQLTALTLNDNRKLRKVDCNSNNLQGIMDISDNLDLKYFNCTDNSRLRTLLLRNGQQNTIEELLKDDGVEIKFVN